MRRLSLLLLLAVLGVFGQQPTQAQTATWTAEFFDNPYFIGTPDFTDVQNSVAYNWGTDAPRDGFPADNFTVRLATDVFMPAGNYRFYMLADDGASVTLDFNQRIINTFDDPRPGDTITANIQIERSAVYHIQIDYREIDNDAYIYFDYENTDDGVSGPNFPTNPNPSPDEDPNLTGVPGAFWTGQYYNNVNLSGFPAAIVGTNGLQLDWGLGSPLGNIQSDNFSARWNGVYNFDGGEYVVSVSADDGVRVYLDGVRIINQWNLATGQTYTATIQPTAGNHTFTVEMFEEAGRAFIDFQLFRRQAATNTSPYNAFATVTASRLNVRAIPEAPAGQILTKISGQESYPIVGRIADNSWVQIRVNNIDGWVSGSWVNVTNLQNVPITYGNATQPAPTQPPVVTDYTAFTRTEVNLRTGPSTSFDRIVIVPQNINVDIIGRNLRATWWEIDYNGTRGWVSANFAVIEDGADLSQIPVTDN